MPTLNIKPTHKPIKTYYAELKAYAKIGAEHEGAVRTAFQNLLQHYCRQVNLILVCEKTRVFPPDKGGQDKPHRADASAWMAKSLMPSICHMDTGKRRIHTMTFDRSTKESGGGVSV